MVDENGLQIFGGESIIKSLNQSSARGSTVTFEITDELYAELRGHEGKIGSLFWRETGNDGQFTVTKPFKSKPKVDVVAKFYDQQNPVGSAKSERWKELGGRTKWLIDRCKDPAFQKFCGTFVDVWTGRDRENATKGAMAELFGFETSRKEVEDSKHYRTFDILRNDFAKYLEKDNA